MDSDESLGKLRLLGRLSLWFAAVAAVAFVALLYLAAPPSPDYFVSIGSLAATRQGLPLLMGAGALLLAVGTALTTWLIALYASFRVAGPLHRFCIDLEQGVRTGEVPRIRIRDSDYIQAEANHLEATVAGLYRYHDELAQAIEAALQRLDARPGDGAGAGLEQVRVLAARLKP